MTKFTVLNEDSIFKEAESVTTFTYNNKDYILYFVKDYDNNDSNLLISRLETSYDGYHHIRPIENEEEKQEIFNKFKLSYGGEVHD